MNPEDEFDDFDVDEGFDDEWIEEDLDFDKSEPDDSVHTSSKRNKSKYFLFIIIALLAGLIFAIYPYFLRAPVEDVPIVKIDNGVNTENIEDQTAPRDDMPVFDAPIVDRNIEPAEIEDTPIQNVTPDEQVSFDQDANDILTPMTIDDDLVLPELDTTNEEEFFSGSIEEDEPAPVEDDFDFVDVSDENAISSLSSHLERNNIDEEEAELNDRIEEGAETIVKQEEIGESGPDSIEEKQDSSFDEKPADIDRLNEPLNGNTNDPLVDEKPVKEEPPEIITNKVEEVPPVQKIEIQKKPKVQSVPAWIIRAAQPGRAVIFDKKSEQMKSIEVGVYVAGIGKIEKIAQDASGKWFVEGDSGRID